MKRLGIIMLTILIALSFTGFAMAADQIAEHKGSISKIDEKAKTFTVKDDKGKETTMAVDDMKMLAGLNVGDKVTCKHLVKGKKNICKGVTKEAAAPAAAPAAKPKKAVVGC